MSKIRYRATSPYALTPQTDQSIGLYVPRPIPVNSGDTEFVVTPRHHNRPDLLAHDLYGSVGYWWVFMVRNLNLIRDPIFDLKAGMTIVVPSPEHLKKVIG